MAAALVFLFLCVLPVAKSAMTIALDSNGKWPGGVVPYQFHDQIRDFDKLRNVVVAMQQVEEFTGGCVRFQPREDEEDYIIIQVDSFGPDSPCFSYVGRTGAWQPVRLAAGCLETPGAVLHVLGQLLGLFPENNRPDRNQYITIDWDNVQQSKLGQLSEISASEQTHLFNPDRYDFASITHITQTQYSINSSLLTWKLRRGVAHPGVEIGGSIGQRIGFSITDIEALRFLYNCHFISTVYPELACNGNSTESEPPRGQAAGWHFCQCRVGNDTGQPYYTGQYCESIRCTPDCSTIPNSICLDKVINSRPVISKWPQCQCKAGWKGEFCEEYDCFHACQNGGVCTGPNRCTCPSGYTGTGCRTATFCRRECKNGGECVSSEGAAKCKCQIGWSGELCTEPKCEEPCLNNGVCIAPDVCRCPTGLTGLRCENANSTFGLPCRADIECQAGWGDKNSICNLVSPCPSVKNTCVCKPGYTRLPSGGKCRPFRKLGERCSWKTDVCEASLECVQNRCQCDKVRGWVQGPLHDCVKAEKLRTTSGRRRCAYFDDCLYGKVCSATGRCHCPRESGLIEDVRTGGVTCRPIEMDESCQSDNQCRLVAVGATCRSENRTVSARRCLCKKGIPYRYLIDRYTIGKTCIPPFPRRFGERCSVDFTKHPQYGPCERGLTCELCPLTTDEYRCHDFDRVVPIGRSARLNSSILLLIFLSYLSSQVAFHCCL